MWTWFAPPPGRSWYYIAPAIKQFAQHLLCLCPRSVSFTSLWLTGLSHAQTTRGKGGQGYRQEAKALFMPTEPKVEVAVGTVLVHTHTMDLACTCTLRLLVKEVWEGKWEGGGEEQKSRIEGSQGEKLF